MDAKEKINKALPASHSPRRAMARQGGSVSIGVRGASFNLVNYLHSARISEELLVKFPFTTLYLTNKFQLEKKEKKVIDRHFSSLTESVAASRDVCGTHDEILPSTESTETTAELTETTAESPTANTAGIEDNNGNSISFLNIPCTSKLDL